MNCSCVDRINEQLKTSGLRLALTVCVTKELNMVTAIPVATEPIEIPKRKKSTPAVMATFCPWCGIKMEDAK